MPSPQREKESAKEDNKRRCPRLGESWGFLSGAFWLFKF
jgi:hypothetical protein